MLSQAMAVQLWSWIMPLLCSISPQKLAMSLQEQWDVIRGSHGAEDSQNLLEFGVCPGLFQLIWECSSSERGAWPFSSISDPDVPKPVVLDLPHLLLDAAASLSLSHFGYLG